MAESLPTMIRRAPPVRLSRRGHGVFLVETAGLLRQQTLEVAEVHAVTVVRVWAALRNQGKGLARFLGQLRSIDGGQRVRVGDSRASSCRVCNAR